VRPSGHFLVCGRSRRLQTRKWQIYRNPMPPSFSDADFIKSIDPHFDAAYFVLCRPWVEEVKMMRPPPRSTMQAQRRQWRSLCP
jgi:hypothetical protein